MRGRDRRTRIGPAVVAAGPGGDSAADRRRRRRARRADRHLPAQAGRATPPSSTRPPIALGGRCWSHPRRVRRRPDRRARRRADRPGPPARCASSSRSSGSTSTTCSPASPTAPRPSTLRRAAATRSTRRRTTSRGSGSRSTPTSSAASYPTLYNSSTQRGRELDAMSIADWINAYVPGGMASKLGQLLDVAYNIEYGAETSEQSSLNMLYLLGYAGPGNLRIFGKSNEKYHVRGGNDQIAGAARRGARRPDHDRLRADRDPAQRRRHATGSPSSRAARRRSVTADHVVLALPFSILRTVDYSQGRLRAGARCARSSELGMGTNSKLHVQFNDRLWRGLGCNGETYADTGYQNTWEVSRAQAGTSGILVDYTGGTIGASFGTRHAGERARSSSSARSSRCCPGSPRSGTAAHDRLLDRQPVDEGLLLLLEGRPVHGVLGRRARALGQLPLRRRAHLDRLPGLPERRRRTRARARPTRSSADLK